MVQGFRRCQAQCASTLTVGGLTEHGREIYTGGPTWRVDNATYVNHPGGYYRMVDEETGVLRWTHDDGFEGAWETGPFWQ